MREGERIAAEIEHRLASRGAPALEQPYTPAEWDIISKHGRAAVTVENGRLDNLLQDDGFWSSGCTKGLYPGCDMAESYEHALARQEAFRATLSEKGQRS